MKHKKHKKYALFVGRWQPFHDGHKYLIDEAIAEGKNICIAIRDTKLSKKNPYTVHQRKEMIRKVYGDKVKIITIPDIESINFGRNVGYEIHRIDAPEEITEISGTNIRKGEENRVPKAAAEYLRLLRTTIWFTGLPCSGKTTLVKQLKKELDRKGCRTVHLDGDVVRKGLNIDLGFSEEDRKENLRRVAHIAKLLNQQGNTVIASFVSPTNEMRSMVREIIGDMKLVYVKCSLKECEKRDREGMYKKARKGKIKDFTGISAPFEEPNADVVTDTENNSIDECIEKIIKKLKL